MVRVPVYYRGRPRVVVVVLSAPRGPSLTRMDPSLRFAFLLVHIRFSVFLAETRAGRLFLNQSLEPSQDFYAQRRVRTRDL